MGISLGANQYGKAENRVVRVYRDTARHELVDLNVSTSLRGDFADAHVTGDQADVLPTDTQKNTAFAYAKRHGVTFAGGLRHRSGPALPRSGAQGRQRPDPGRAVPLGSHRDRARRPRPRVRPARRRNADDRGHRDATAATPSTCRWCRASPTWCC